MSCGVGGGGGPQGGRDHCKGPSTVDILQRPEMGAGVDTDVPYTGTQGTGWEARHAPPSVGWPPSGAFSRRSGGRHICHQREGERGEGGCLSGRVCPLAVLRALSGRAALLLAVPGHRSGRMDTLAVPGKGGQGISPPAMASQDRGDDLSPRSLFSWDAIRDTQWHRCHFSSFVEQLVSSSSRHL